MKIEQNILEKQIEDNFENSTNYDLFKLYFENKNIKIRNELLLRNQPLITFIINKYYPSNRISREIKEELQQEGVLGLISAIDGFDYRKGFKFSSYSSWWIRQSINNYLINVNPIIKVPNHIKCLQNKLQKSFEDKETSNILELNHENIKNSDIKISKKMLESIKSAIKSKQVTSLQKPIYNDGELTTLEHVIESNDNIDFKIDREIMIKTAAQTLKALPDKKRLILLLRFNVLNKKSTKKDK